MKKCTNIARIQSLITLIATFGLNMPIYSCVINFTNDSPSELLLIDKNDAKAYKIGKNKTIKFGDEHTKAQFALFDKKPRARSFNLCCTCKQNACAGNKHPKLTYSGVMNGADIMKLFTVHKIKKTK